MSAYRICVYAGSSFGASPEYSAAAAAFGSACARRGLGIVYGGGSVGLMGILADAALAAGGEVIGIIPRAMIAEERAHHSLTELIPVESMHERKHRMAQHANAFVALPGGIGTLEEVIEAFTWLQLGLHLKPVGLLNIGGYYDRLLTFLQQMCDEQFLTTAHHAMLTIEQDAEMLLDRITVTQHAHIPKPVHHAAKIAEPINAANGTSCRKQSIGHVSLVVRDYDEAIDFYVETLGFTLVENSIVPDQDKRWVIVAPPGSKESRIVLSRATSEEQLSRVGNQTGGRVFLFLFTDNFWRDYQSYKDKGVVFVRAPQEYSYGIVAVFQDLYGNLWDLLQRAHAGS